MDTQSITPEAAPVPVPAPKTDRRTDLGAIPMGIPWALLTEYQAAAVLSISVKTLRRSRYEGGGPRFIKMNGTSVRYRVSDVQEFLASQPTGGGSPREQRRGPGRPRKAKAAA